MAVLGRRAAAAAIALAIGGLALAGGSPPVYSSREQALARAFPPPATIERKTFFLTEAERDKASRAARAKVDSALVIAYVAKGPNGILGTGYFDTHTVRTMPETILVTVKPDGSLQGVEVIAFGEPEDYLPRRNWLKLFPGRRLDDELAVGRGLAHVTGATLTTRVIADAVRRVLAVHALVSGRS
ncbi:MAG TPA: FMN-binding protein [Thermoanaerobaculia bacterium]|nr:FMN-binding protein [Thermoanaerobaculia bacterium]